MKKFIFVFLFILFITPNVLASNTNISNKISYTHGGTKGTYEGDEIYLGGYNGHFTVGTRYNGRLGELSFYLNVSDYNFKKNHTYTITLNMATEDWRNHFMGPQVIEANSSGTLGSSLTTNNFRFVSYKQIKFNFKTDGSLPIYLFFRLYSTDYANPNGGSTAITGTNNWNLSSIYINDNVSATPTPAPVTPAPTPTPQPSNQDIINSANQNTEDIINNQNQNTNNLIENNNQNTSDIIENNNQNSENIINSVNEGAKAINEVLGNACPNLANWNMTDENKFTLTATTNDTFYESNYKVSLNAGTTYYFSYSRSGGTGTRPYEIILSYNNSYAYYLGGYYNDSFSFTPQQTGDYYLRMDCNNQGDTCIYWNFYVGSVDRSYCPFGSYSSKLDDTNNAINDLNGTISNDNIDDNTGFFSDFENNDHGLTSIITIPLTTIQQLTNSSCVALSVPIPFTNSNVNLPCMTEVYQQHIPTIFNLWQVVSFGIISYFICIDIYKIVKGFKDPNEDKVEVLDL